MLTPFLEKCNFGRRKGASGEEHTASLEASKRWHLYGVRSFIFLKRATRDDGVSVAGHATAQRDGDGGGDGACDPFYLTQTVKIYRPQLFGTCSPDSKTRRTPILECDQFFKKALLVTTGEMKCNSTRGLFQTMGDPDHSRLIRCLFWGGKNHIHFEVEVVVILDARMDEITRLSPHRCSAMLACNTTDSKPVTKGSTEYQCTVLPTVALWIFKIFA